jgi:hypothetical protein
VWLFSRIEVNPEGGGNQPGARSLIHLGGTGKRGNFQERDFDGGEAIESARV